VDFSAAFPTFFITLREGVEAALVVGIVLACLGKAERSRSVSAGESNLNQWVYWGIAAGLVGSIFTGIVFVLTLQQIGASPSPYAPVIQEILEVIFCFAAIVLLSWMLVWMTQQARLLKSELETAVKDALDQSRGWGIFGLVTIAVLREGFETVLFIVSQLQAGWPPTLGAIVGLFGAVSIGFLLFQGGLKINLRLFFQSMGIVLLLIVSGLVISLLHKLEVVAALLIQIDPQYAAFCLRTQDSCLLGFQVWDASQTLPEKEFPGILLKTFLGYRQDFYIVQLVSYLIFLITVGGLYLKSLGSYSNAK
jgi:high-affinity iron transporter